MSRRTPTYAEYLCQYASPGETGPRAEALEWLRERELMGILPDFTKRSPLREWQEFWLVSPMHLRPALGKLWREYERWVRMRHRLIGGNGKLRPR